MLVPAHSEFDYWLNDSKTDIDCEKKFDFYSPNHDGFYILSGKIKFVLWSICEDSPASHYQIKWTSVIVITTSLVIIY